MTMYAEIAGARTLHRCSRAPAGRAPRRNVDGAAHAMIPEQIETEDQTENGRIMYAILDTCF